MTVRRFLVAPHPTVEGGWTILPHVDGVRLLIASKERAEVLCYQRNERMRKIEGSKIRGL